MAIGYKGLPPLSPVDGVRLASVSAGVRYKGRDDVLLIELAKDSCCAAVFTQNAFCAAPVVVAKRHLALEQPRYLVVNSGNANAGTGETGLLDAEHTCASLAEIAGCKPEQVLPFSTGVIGEKLPVERIAASMRPAVEALTRDGWATAARTIMTTDTVAKGVSRTVEVGGQSVVITGIAKGAGMIRPDMATMLAYIATDAAVDAGDLQSCLVLAVEKSFNRITVDGDTSTNDACVLAATGQSGAPRLNAGHPEFKTFCDAVGDVCMELAQLIVRDAEGATKFVTVRVEGGGDSMECLHVAYTVAHSPLVKTALFASDPNWGRILAAVGRAGIASLDTSKINIFLDDVCIVRAGGRSRDYQEREGQAVLKQEEILIRIHLGRGDASETIWTCDLSHEYVRINAEYRS